MLSEDLKNKLLLAATEAREQAYAPYSGGFKVGAAVLTEEGEIFSGCNVENASFGVTVCAERVAVFKAISKGHRKIQAVAIVAGSQNLVPPCGMCLQVISEFGDDADVIIANTVGDVTLCNMKDLLPRAFKFEPRNR